MNNLFIISISFSPDISKNNSLTNSPSLACLILSVSVALHRLISAVNLFRSLSFDLFFSLAFLLVANSSSETQGQIVGARQSLNKRKNMAQKKVKNGQKSP